MTLCAHGAQSLDPEFEPLVPVAFQARQDPTNGAAAPTLDTNGHYVGVTSGMGVRRLTPRECERLQGFADDWTAIEGAADTPRYRAIGNSMAVPVVEWILRRLNAAREEEDQYA